MIKKIIYLTLVILLFVSCEEYYKPKIDAGPRLLVVDAHLTNDTSQNYVRLTLSQDYYSKDGVETISGALVYLIEVGGQPIPAVESSRGYYTFPQTPVPGRKYKLRISVQEDSYESEEVLMPPLPKIDTLTTNYKLEKTYLKNYYDNLEEVLIPSREITIDAPVTPELQYYRFSYRAVLQWIYNPLPQFPPPPVLYGWKSKFDNGSFNTAGPSEYSNSSWVTNHPIVSLAYNNTLYLDSVTQIGEGWILILDQYGITPQSYKMYEGLNKQFSADGSLFDPILAQIYGNIHCTTDASKIALGFFDLSSYRQYRYYLNFGKNENYKVIQRRLNRYPVIPHDNYLQGVRPFFWEFDD